MANLLQLSTNTAGDKLFPLGPHSVIICGITGCRKTVFTFDLMEECYREAFQHIVILCPTIKYNEVYQKHSWLWGDPEV